MYKGGQYKAPKGEKENSSKTKRPSRKAKRAEFAKARTLNNPCRERSSKAPVQHVLQNPSATWNYKTSDIYHRSEELQSGDRLRYQHESQGLGQFENQ